MNWQEFSHAFLTLLTIVDPIGAVPLFLLFTENIKNERAQVAGVTAMAVALILFLVVISGTQILSFFNISLPAFQVAGGIILLIIGIEMLHAKRGRTRHTPEEDQDALDSKAVAVIPLAMPLLAGPGAISSVLLLNIQYPGFWGKVHLIGVCLLVSFMVWGAMRLAPVIDNYISRTVVNIVTRIMGLILMAISVGFFVDGLKVLLNS